MQLVFAVIGTALSLVLVSCGWGESKLDVRHVDPPNFIAPEIGNIGGNEMRQNRYSATGPQTAEVAWTYEVESGSYAGIAYDPTGIIYIPGRNALTALDMDGNYLWRFAAPQPIISEPFVNAEGLVLFLCADGHFFALNPDGTLAYSRDDGGGANDDIKFDGQGNYVAVSMTTPNFKIRVVDQDGVELFQETGLFWYAEIRQGRLYTLNWAPDIPVFEIRSLSGENIFSVTLPEEAGLGHFRVSPNGTVYLGTNIDDDAHITAYSPNGELLWEKEVHARLVRNGETMASGIEDRLYLVEDEEPEPTNLNPHSLRCYDSNGALLWSRPKTLSIDGVTPLGNLVVRTEGDDGFHPSIEVLDKMGNSLVQFETSSFRFDRRFIVTDEEILISASPSGIRQGIVTVGPGSEELWFYPTLNSLKRPGFFLGEKTVLFDRGTICLLDSNGQRVSATNIGFLATNIGAFNNLDFLVAINNGMIQAYTPDFTQIWEYPLVGSSSNGSLVTSAGRTYALTGRHFMTCVDSEGSELYSLKLDQESRHELAVDSQGTAYVACGSTYYAVNYEGQVTWTYTGEEMYWDYPVVHPDGLVLFGSLDSMVALDGSGQVVWSIGSEEEPVRTSLPAIGDDGTVYMCVDPDSEMQLDGPSQLESGLAAFDADGQLMWQYPVYSPHFTQPAVDGMGNVYFNVRGAIVALQNNGELLWMAYYHALWPAISTPHTLSISPDGKLLVYSYYQMGAIGN